MGKESFDIHIISIYLRLLAEPNYSIADMVPGSSSCKTPALQPIRFFPLCHNIALHMQKNFLLLFACSFFRCRPTLQMLPSPSLRSRRSLELELMHSPLSSFSCLRLRFLSIKQYICVRLLKFRYM